MAYSREEEGRDGGGGEVMVEERGKVQRREEKRGKNGKVVGLEGKGEAGKVVVVIGLTEGGYCTDEEEGKGGGKRMRQEGRYSGNGRWHYKKEGKGGGGRGKVLMTKKAAGKGKKESKGGGESRCG